MRRALHGVALLTAAACSRDPAQAETQLAPPECDVTLLEDPPVLAWRSCSGAPCVELAPPASAWGFGGAVSATIDRGVPVIALGWARTSTLWETAVFRGDTPIAGWRSNLAAGCLASTPVVEGGTATAVILRTAAEDEPWLIDARLDHLGAAAGRPIHVLRPSDRLARGEQIVMQREGGATVVDGGEPIALDGALDAAPTRAGVVFARSGMLWLRGFPVTGNVSRVAARDGDLAVLRGDGWLELASVSDPAATRRIARVPGSTAIAISGGWLIARVSDRDIRLWRIDGTDARRLPRARARYAGVAGIAVARGEVYALAAPPGVPPNDHRILERWPIDELPRL